MQFKILLLKWYGWLSYFYQDSRAFIFACRAYSLYELICSFFDFLVFPSFITPPLISSHIPFLQLSLSRFQDPSAIAAFVASSISAARLHARAELLKRFRMNPEAPQRPEDVRAIIAVRGVLITESNLLLSRTWIYIHMTHDCCCLSAVFLMLHLAANALFRLSHRESCF